MSKKSFPQVLFVVSEKETDGSEYLLAYKSPQEAGDLTESVEVATYQLVERRNLGFFTPTWSKKLSK